MKRLSCLLILLAFVGCKRESAASSSPKEINALCWSEYVPQEVLDGFEKETGTKVNIDAVSSNEQMAAKLSAGATHYDLCQPSEYFVEDLIATNRLAAIDWNNVPNIANVLPEFKNQPFDPGNKFSAPYMSGCVGIVYDSKKITTPINSFADVFKPEHAGRIIVVDDNREMVSWAMIAAGIPINEMSDANLEKVRPTLAAWVKLIKKYDSDSPKTDLIAGNVDIGVIWNGEAALCLDADPKFKWVVPSEGTHRYIDNLAVPSDAPNKATAEKFINYCLRPDVSKLISNAWPYTNPNGPARGQLTEPQRNNPASYPQLKDPQTFRRIDAKQSEAIEKMMTELRGG